MFVKYDFDIIEKEVMRFSPLLKIFLEPHM